MCQQYELVTGRQGLYRTYRSRQNPRSWVTMYPAQGGGVWVSAPTWEGDRAIANTFLVTRLSEVKALFPNLKSAAQRLGRSWE